MLRQAGPPLWALFLISVMYGSDIIKATKYEIMGLQDTHSTSANVKIWEKEWGGQCFWSHGQSNV